MNSHVYFQCTVSSTTLATFCALMFTLMHNSHMQVQGALRFKTFLTLSTRINAFSSVSVTFSVNIQFSFPCKLFVTHRTHKRLLACVRPSVIIQTSSLCKSFVTQCTRVWLQLLIAWMSSDSISLYLHALRRTTAISFCLIFYRTCLLYTSELPTKRIV